MWKLFADCRAGVLSGITVTPKRPAQAPKEIEKNGLGETYANFFKVLIAVFFVKFLMFEYWILYFYLERSPAVR